MLATMGWEMGGRIGAVGGGSGGLGVLLLAVINKSLARVRTGEELK